jgi:hypothetical protein
VSWLDGIREDLRQGERSRHHHHRDRLESEIFRLQRELDAARATEHGDAAKIEGQLAEITSLLSRVVVAISATGIRLIQLNALDAPAPQGAHDMPIDPTLNGIAKGTTGYFQASPLPAGGQLKAGTGFTFTTGDTSVSLGPTPSGDATMIAATVAAGETLPSFGLTVSAIALDGTPLQTTFTIPVLPGGSTGGTPATSIDLNQITAAAAGGTTTPPPPPPVNPVASPASVSVAVGATQALAISETSGDVTSTSTFASDNPAVATVDGTGVVTGISAGNANVLVTDASGNSTTVPVTVGGGGVAPIAGSPLSPAAQAQAHLAQGRIVPRA